MDSINPLNEKVAMNNPVATNPMHNMSSGSAAAANRMQPMSHGTGHHINPLNAQINPHPVVKPVSHDMLRHLNCVIISFKYLLYYVYMSILFFLHIKCFFYWPLFKFVVEEGYFIVDDKFSPTS